ncbi:unnamed protein product [Didymodactylos carnosus]|uniref:BRCT domain-containing protein n=1 Tax=Didymodactylos carnosus TaxID=1234261 RepID=A0A8S2P034_9BILA|nr:unnamed protein product [Didymodactylos carnosus]CAF4026653.1 unnamed protein product [Didymodactylos carnosus]
MSLESSDPYEFIQSQISNVLDTKVDKRGRKKTKTTSVTSTITTFITHKHPAAPIKRTESVPTRTPSTRERKSITRLNPAHISPSKTKKRSPIRSENNREFSQSDFSQFIEMKKVNKKARVNKRHGNMKKKKSQEDDKDYHGYLPEAKRSKSSSAAPTAVDIDQQNIHNEVEAIEQTRLIYETPNNPDNSQTFIPSSIGFSPSIDDNNDTHFQEKIEKLNEKMTYELPILLTKKPTKEVATKTTTTVDSSISENIRPITQLTNHQTVQTEKEAVKDETTQTERPQLNNQIIQTTDTSTISAQTAVEKRTISTNTNEIRCCSLTTQTSLEETIKLNQIVQTSPPANHEEQLQHHLCCQDITQCPCVQSYGKTECFFMQTLSTFFNRIRPIHNNRHQHSRPLPVRRLRQRRVNIRSNNFLQPQVQQQEEEEEYEDTAQENNVCETIMSQNQNIVEVAPFQQCIIEQNLVQNNQILDNNTISEKDELQHRDNISDITVVDEQTLRSFIIVKEDAIEPLSRQNIEHFPEVSSIEMVMIAEQESLPPLNPLDLRQENYSEEKWKHIVLASTSLNDQQKCEFDKFINYFNIEYSPIVNAKTTHLITDEEGDTLACSLTGKVIQAISRHIFIVSYRWIIKCLEQKHYIDETTYEIRGDLSCDRTHNGMMNSRTNPYQLLFNNYAFILKCSGCLPFSNNQSLIELIQLNGGLVIQNLSDNVEHCQKIILCSQEFLQNKKSFSQLCTRLNIQCCKPQWLLVSITKYQIVPFKDYEVKKCNVD